MSPNTSDDPRVDAGTDSDEWDSSTPWQQRLYQNVWVWAGAAILFWLVSYVIWGWIDLLLLPEG